MTQKEHPLDKKIRLVFQDPSPEQAKSWNDLVAECQDLTGDTPIKDDESIIHL
jgi:hypothetical protein